jgi:hypothetical protein
LSEETLNFVSEGMVRIAFPELLSPFYLGAFRFTSRNQAYGLEMFSRNLTQLRGEYRGEEKNLI